MLLLSLSQHHHSTEAAFNIVSEVVAPSAGNGSVQCEELVARR
jgi:hypothetical protein